jgi:hypothetical protein
MKVLVFGDMPVRVPRCYGSELLGSTYARERAFQGLNLPAHKNITALYVLFNIETPPLKSTQPSPRATTSYCVSRVLCVHSVFGNLLPRGRVRAVCFQSLTSLYFICAAWAGTPSCFRL